MASRTGVPAIIAVSKEICRLIVKFTPVIKKEYPDATALHDALDVASTACSVLVPLLEAVREIGD